MENIRHKLQKWDLIPSIRNFYILFSNDLMLAWWRPCKVEACKKRKAIPWQAWAVPEGSRRLRFPHFKKHESGKVSPTHRPLLLSRKYSRYSFLLRLSQPQGHSAAGRIMSMKNSNDTIGNRTRDHAACRIVKEYGSLVVSTVLLFFSSIKILNLFAWNADVMCEYREEWGQSVTTTLCSYLMCIMQCGSELIKSYHPGL